MLNMLGLHGGIVRPPLVEVSEAEKKELQNIFMTGIIIFTIIQEKKSYVLQERNTKKKQENQIILLKN